MSTISLKTGNAKCSPSIEVRTSLGSLVISAARRKTWLENNCAEKNIHNGGWPKNDEQNLTCIHPIQVFLGISSTRPSCDFDVGEYFDLTSFTLNIQGVFPSNSQVYVLAKFDGVIIADFADVTIPASVFPV